MREIFLPLFCFSYLSIYFLLFFTIGLRLRLRLRLISNGLFIPHDEPIELIAAIMVVPHCLISIHN